MSDVSRCMSFPVSMSLRLLKNHIGKFAAMGSVITLSIDSTWLSVRSPMFEFGLIPRVSMTAVCKTLAYSLYLGQSHKRLLLSGNVVADYPYDCVCIPGCSSTPRFEETPIKTMLGASCNNVLAGEADAACLHGQPYLKSSLLVQFLPLHIPLAASAAPFDSPLWIYPCAEAVLALA